MRFELTILGCNSAIPANDRHPTAQVLNVQDQLFLIDCGEGTQIQMQRYRIKRNKINHIFISHLHGDHVLGLIGLLNSYALAGRKNPMYLYGPIGLEELVHTSMRLMHSHSTYDLVFQEVNTEESQLVLESNMMTVHSIPLIHRIPTTGYLFREKEHLRSIKVDKIDELNINYSHIKEIKKGADYLHNGVVIPNAELTFPPPAPRSYAYCSDTMYNEALIPLIKGADLLYHETTFMQSDLQFAIKTKHSTAQQAATIALKAQVGTLITGHYSSRYQNLALLRDEARSVFSKTVLGEEGNVYAVPFKREALL